jgi:hypothetical protein
MQRESTPTGTLHRFRALSNAGYKVITTVEQSVRLARTILDEAMRR